VPNDQQPGHHAGSHHWQIGGGPITARSLAPWAGQDTSISGRVSEPAGGRVALWLRVRDVDAAVTELAERGATVLRVPRDEPWGLREAWLADRAGTRIALVQVPPEHPMRCVPRPDADFER